MDCESFLDWAKGRGWTVERRAVPLSLPREVSGRYPVPADYLDFLERAAICAGPAIVVAST